MRVPVEWLSEYVDIASPIDGLADKLTMAGLEVEEVAAVPPAELERSGGVPDEKDSRVLHTKVTPNRGDWLSMVGVAREISATTGWKFRMLEPKAEGVLPETASHIKISILDPDLCRRYIGIVVRNVKIKDSPDWMKNRLVRAGMRPINNIVDITNYVMLELGQPLHAFDYDMLKGREIIVRRAHEGETITSLDGAERYLQPDMLVIADRERAVAIAGVMGGAESEVNPHTKNILIESAHFNPVSIRRTSKMLGMVTESSYRFERSVDIGTTDLAAMRAAELMRDLGDGEIALGMVDVYPGKTEPKKIEVRPERVNWILGADFDPADMISHLKALQIPAEYNGKIIVTVPTFRTDMELEVDVIEEIARVHGYENIGETLPAVPLQGSDSEVGLFTERLRGIFMACGMQEVLTHSVVDPYSVEMTGLGEKIISVRNPLSEEVSKLRTMLAPNLLRVMVRNQSVGIRDISVFEIGKVYRWVSDGEPSEFRSAAGAMVGSQWGSSWSLDKNALAADFYFAKGVLESVFSRLGIENAVFTPVEHPMLHPTRAAAVRIGDVEIGLIGEVAPDIRETLDVRGRPCIFELNVDELMKQVPESVGYRQLPRFPALYRHLATVISKNIPYDSVQCDIMQAGGHIIEEVELLDVYTGEHVGENERSLTLSLVFRSPERTLTDEEVNQVLDGVKDSLVRAFGASFRG